MPVHTWTNEHVHLEQWSRSSTKQMLKERVFASMHSPSSHEKHESEKNGKRPGWEVFNPLPHQRREDKHHWGGTLAN